MKHKVLLDYFKALNKYHFIFGSMLLITMIYANYLILTLPIQFRFPKVKRSDIPINKNNNTIQSYITIVNESSKINANLDPILESNPLLSPVPLENSANKTLNYLNQESHNQVNFLENTNQVKKQIINNNNENNVLKNINDKPNDMTKQSKYVIDDYCNYLLNKNSNQNLNYELYIDEENSIKNWSYNYQLYCENEYKKNYITSLIFACSIISNLVMSVVADRYGRKFCFLFEAFGMLLAFVFLFLFGAHNFAILLIAIFGLQLFTHLFTVSYIYSYEFFTNKYYNWIFLLQSILFSFLGILIFYLVEYSKSLYYIELTAFVVSAIIFMLAYLYILESPDWLISKMKHVEDKVNELLEENEDDHITQEKFKHNMKKINHFVDEFHLLKKEINSVYQKFLEWDKPENREEKKE